MDIVKDKPPLLVCFGHHKCALMWIREILSDVCPLTNLSMTQISRVGEEEPSGDIGQEDARTHYRKGMPRDWAKRFEPVHVEHFKQLYNDGLLQLGHETTSEWSATPG